jgi:hypothetical protein
MNNVSLSTEIVNSLLQYLGSRPYVEVVGFINGIQQQAQAQAAQAPVVEVKSEPAA